MQQPVLSFGFSPAAAVASWRLVASNSYQVYTYWPVNSIQFNSDAFGQQVTQDFQHFDIANSKQIASLPFKTFSVVILVVPAISDVSRMCKRLSPVISKSTTVLVDVSGGFAPLQRYVKGRLGSSYNVNGVIFDIDAELEATSETQWMVKHSVSNTRSAASTGTSVVLEPGSNSVNKVLTALEAAWKTSNLTAQHLKNSNAFGELQWQRNIAIVAYELLGYALSIPDPNAVASNLIAKPILEGLINELCSVALACGTKNVSAKQIISAGASNVRLAPASSNMPKTSRVFFDLAEGNHVFLDFVLLLPILLSDALPKGGVTPYLESLYAYITRKLESEKEGGGAARLGAASKELEAKEQEVTELREELAKLDQKIKEQDSEINASRTQTQRNAQFNHEMDAKYADFMQRDKMLKHKEMELIHREQQFAQYQQQQQQAQMQMQMQKSEQPLQQGAGMLPSPDVAAAVPPPPTTPGGTALSRFDPKAQVYTHNNENSNGSSNSSGSSSGPVPGQVPRQGSMPVLPSSMPNMQGQMPGSIPGQLNQMPPVNQMSNYGMPYTHGHVSNPSVSSSIYNGQPAMPRKSYSGPIPSNNPVRSQSRGQVAQSMQFYPTPQGYPPVNMQQGRPRRVSRRTSNLNEDIDMMSLTASRNRHRSVPNGGGMPGMPGMPGNMPAQDASRQQPMFSQDFQLDSVMNTATDRYHFVSRAKNHVNDPKLSSNDAAFQARRKVLHGGASPEQADQSFSSVESRQFNPAFLTQSPSFNGSSPAFNNNNNNNNNTYAPYANGSNNARPNRKPVDPYSAAMATPSTAANLSMNSSIPSNTVSTSGTDYNAYSFQDQVDPLSASSGSVSNVESRGTPPTPHQDMDMPAENWHMNEKVPA